MSHMKSTHLTQQEFQQKWGDMEQIILRLGNGIPDLSENIQSLKEENIDPAKELQLLETLKEWEERDKILAIEMEKVNVRLDEMGNEVDQIKDSVIAQNKKKTESENELKNQGRMLDIMAAKELDTENRMSTLNIEVSDLGNKISSIQEKQNTLDLKAEEERKNLTVEHEKLYDRLDKTESKTKEIESAVLDIKLKVTEDKKYKYEDVSSELKSLASMTELYLENIARDEVYVPTNAHVQAKERLNKSGCLILSGLPGEGKTTMATKIISETIKPGRCLKLREPSDWRHIDLSKDLFDTIFIDDIFGAGALDEQLLKGWTTFLPDLEQAVRKKKIAVVITTRHYILEEARDKMRRLNLFKDEKVQLLTSSELTQSERTDILEAHLKHSNRQFGSTLIEDCNISYNTSFRNLHYQFPDHVSETGELSEYLRAGKWTRIRAMVGFPEIAHLFSNNDQVFQRGASFFEQPLTFFRKCMEDLFLDEEKFLSLILVWARPDQKLQILEFNEIEMSNEISMTAKRFGFKLKGKLLRLLKKSLNYHKDGFLKFEPQTGIYSFCHNIVKDMVGLVAGQEFPDEVLEYASEDFIMQYVTTDQEKNDGFHILIDEFRFSKLNSVICKLLMRKPSPTEVIYELLPLDFEIAKICSVERTNVPDMPMELGEDTMNTSVLKHDCFANKAYVVRFLESNMGRNILPTSSLTITGQFGYYGIDFGEQKIQVFLPSHALLYGNFVLLEEFLKKEFSSVIKNTSEFLYVSLLLASHQGMTNIVEMLLTYGATVNEDAIFIAAEKQHDDTLNCLLEARGENYITQSNIINKNSPLIAAAKKGATLSVQTLINHGVDIEYRNSNNMTAFEKAILYKRPDVCKILLESGAPVNYKTGKFKRTPLHINADVGGKNITELLLQHGASVNARDYRGHYPIQCAAIRGNKHIVDTLLKWDKSQALFRLRSYGKKSVLNGMDLVHIAVWKQNPELLDVLIENNVNVNARDFYGRTPFYRAVFQHFTYLYDSEDEFEENSEIIKKLLNVADVQQPEKNGFTPLHAAIHKGHTNVAKLICPQANVNAQDRFGKTALHTACEKFNFEMFKTLVEEFNADVRMLTKKGKTVMHILAEQTNLMRIHSRTMKLGEMGKVPLEVRYYLVVQRSPLLKNFESVVARKDPEFALRWASYSNQYFSH